MVWYLMTLSQSLLLIEEYLLSTENQVVVRVMNRKFGTLINIEVKF